MLFNDGLYEHESGIKIMVKNGDVYILSTELPLSIRTSDVLNAKKWKGYTNGN